MGKSETHPLSLRSVGHMQNKEEVGKPDNSLVFRIATRERTSRIVDTQGSCKSPPEMFADFDVAPTVFWRMEQATMKDTSAMSVVPAHEPSKCLFFHSGVNVGPCKMVPSDAGFVWNNGIFSIRKGRGDDEILCCAEETLTVMDKPDRPQDHPECQFDMPAYFWATDV